MLRRLAARAGAYAPGIQEHFFWQVSRRPPGATLSSVESWVRTQGRELTELGYYLLAKRSAVPTDAVLGWVEAGRGFRGAILAVDGRKLYDDGKRSEGDAVGLTVHDATSGIAEDSIPADVDDPGVVMLDPWPHVDRFISPPERLDLAHRAHKYAALLVYWSGHG
ncbi:hypothetical protein [Haliangium ochraceum]|uniref:Uncharacterized protein n=1 Tax=Haliangium ochraceum (strain DSM 14365 / JCM 11303 / SMP-2) TaxID=502025 RepID=D0LSG4_HALO1|nr:hypothetical protein [Haliangium ochraceum]ACY15663.1 hypothetical protein Hoch_3161 [Haliangium ochraceum DSM 14365]